MIKITMMPMITHLFLKKRKCDFFILDIISPSEDLWKLAYIRSERRRYMSEANITYETEDGYFGFKKYKIGSWTEKHDPPVADRVLFLKNFC